MVFMIHLLNQSNNQFYDIASGFRFLFTEVGQISEVHSYSLGICCHTNTCAGFYNQITVHEVNSYFSKQKVGQGLRSPWDLTAPPTLYFIFLVQGFFRGGNVDPKTLFV